MSKFEEINTDYTDENEVLHLDGFKPGKEEGEVVAYVFNKQVYYTDPDFRYDSLVKSTVEMLKKDGIVSV